MKKDKIKKKIQKFINFPDRDSKDDLDKIDLDKMLDELYERGIKDGN